MVGKEMQEVYFKGHVVFGAIFIVAQGELTRRGCEKKVGLVEPFFERFEIDVLAQ